MTNPAAQIAAYLEEEGYGTVGTDIFTDAHPDQPIDSISLWTLQGQPASRFFGGASLNRPTVSMIIRNASASEARDVAENIRGLLKLNRAIPELIYVRCPASRAAPLGPDASGAAYRYTLSLEVVY